MDPEENRLLASYPGKFVCSSCFIDDHLRAVIENNLKSKKCSYCNRKSKSHNIAASVDKVIERIFDAISLHYGDPWESGCSWDNEEDKYLNQTWDSDDLLQNYLDLNDDSGELYQDILAAAPYGEWSSVNPWSTTEAEVLGWGWERFVDAVKYRRRFFFTRDKKADDGELHRDDLSPSSLLEIFGQRCASNRLVVQIPAGARILRCRPRENNGEKFTKARELGPPPSRLAKQNRMSPAGISMFYGSDDVKTTLAEMPEQLEYYSIATFETLRLLHFLDLTNVAKPSIFDMSDESDYDWYVFMSKFLRDFASPITRDDRVHIDYVPTQVVTEYLRDVKIARDQLIDGIKYKSARRDGGICYVLFIDEYGVEPRKGELDTDEQESERWRKSDTGYTLKLVSIKNFTSKINK